MANIVGWLCFLLIALNAGFTGGENENGLELEQRLDPVDQVHLGNEALEGAEREKRLGIIKKIGIKAGLLDFVFGKIDSFIDSKTRAVNELDKQNIIKNEKYFGITYPPKTTPNPLLQKSRPSNRPTDPPPVEFPTNSAVSLVIPDRLYGNSFTLVTNASKILGDVIYNTADRAQEFADQVNSKLKNKFVFAKKFLKFKYPVIATSSNSRSSSSSSAGASSRSSSSSSFNLLAKRDAEPV